MTVAPPIFPTRRARCRRCKHRWAPRVEAPRLCPACKARNWWTKRGELMRGRPKKHDASAPAAGALSKEDK